MTVEALVGLNPIMLQPRIMKAMEQQQKRTRNYAEVFTPAWICNKIKGEFYIMIEVFLKVMDKIHIREITFSVFIVCGVILFAPDIFMEKLGLFIWRNKYRSIVGLIFLFCLTCCIMWIFIFLKNQISQIGQGSWRLKRISRRYLKSTISSEEKDFLMQHYYDPDRNEFLNTARVDMTSGNVVTLANAHIIVTGTRMGHGPTSWSYNLQPNVRKYLNKAILKKKIVVGRDGYTWNL